MSHGLTLEEIQNGCCVGLFLLLGIEMPLSTELWRGGNKRQEKKVCIKKGEYQGCVLVETPQHSYVSYFLRLRALQPMNYLEC